MLYCFIHNIGITTLLFFIFSVTPCFAVDVGFYSNDTDQVLRKLDQKFNDISQEFYAPTLSISEQVDGVEIDLSQLYLNAQQLFNTHKADEAISLLYENTKTIKNNLEDDVVLDILSLLLSNHEWNLANYLAENIDKSADSYTVAVSHFLMAKYYAKKNQWAAVNKALQGYIEVLSDKENGYAYLLNGTALQYLKKHKKAINNYKYIGKNSPYYLHAQLNSAIAYIRLGWLTDAQLLLKKQFKLMNKNGKDELINRYYLVLGYALFQNGYNRDAHEILNQISEESQYANRALLGRVLTLIRQGELNAALVTLDQLNKKDSYDLSVAESYLLYPYLHEKQGLGNETLSSFSNASIYFQHRLKELSDIVSVVPNIENGSGVPDLMIQQYKVDVDPFNKELLINNWNRLNYFYNEVKEGELKIKIERLKKQYKAFYSRFIFASIDKRRKNLRSYLNQSQYGLARLYDNNKKK